MKKRNKIILWLTGIPVSLLFTQVISFAEDVTWQENNKAILSNNSVVEDGIRWLSWNFIRLLCILADVAASLYDKTFGMIDITKYPQIESLISSFKPAIIAFMVLCVIALGIELMVMQHKKPIIRNIIISGLVLSSTIFFFSAANDLLISFKGAVLGNTESSVAYEIVNNNLIDLVAIDKNGSISSLNYKAGTGILHNAGVSDKETFDGIDYTETLNWDDAEKGKDLYGWSETFNNYIKYKAVNTYGKYEGVEVYDGILNSTVGNEFYYRYDFDFFTALLEILAIVLVYVALSYKNIRIAYELIVSRILAYFYTADIGSGERLKAILYFIRDMYIVACIGILSIKLFLILTEAITSFGINGLGKGLVAIFIAYVVIDGPNIADRLLGIDAGLSSSIGRTMAIFGLARAGVSAVKGGAAAVGNIGMAAATGKTAAERRALSGNGSMGERAGKFVHNKFSAMSSKSSEKEAKGSYGSPAFMNNKESTGIDKTKDSTRDNQSFTSNTNDLGVRNNAGYNNETFMNNTSNISSSSRNIDSGTKYNNPAFSTLMNELKPSSNASIGERKDFNRQINNIVRGDHKAIKPASGSRVAYKETNYQKALLLEKAYNSKGEDNVKK